MEENIITNEAVDTVEEIVATNSGNGLIYGVVGAAAMGAAIMLATKVVKPMIAKHKAKKEEEDEVIYIDPDKYGEE